MTPRLDFEVRTRADGQPSLYFPFMSMSDIHLGAEEAQAMRLVRWLRHVETDEFRLPGDIVDGELIASRDTWSFGDPWHRQALAQILRMASRTARTIFIPGNHDEQAQRLTGKIFCGIEVKAEDEYLDPQGRRMHIRHGHEFDDAGFTSASRKRFWYRVGDAFNLSFRACDHVVHAALPRLREDFSTAVWFKKTFQPLIDYVRGTSPIIRDAVNRSPYDGLIYGHSHEARFERTHFGKLIINDGCSTDHVQALVHDRKGLWALLTVNGGGVYVEPEPPGLLGQKQDPYFVSWNSLGLSAQMTGEPAPIEDEFTTMADRVMRIVCRAYPAADRRQLREAIRQNDRLLNQFGNAGRGETATALTQQRAEYVRLPVSHPLHP